MPRIDLWFLVAAATCLLVGVSLGIAMGIAHDFHLAPVHAHLNLLGWTSLGLMGLTYRAWPVLARNRVAALAQFGLSAGAAILFPIGIYLSIEHQTPEMAILAALIWLAGVALFLARLLLLCFAREEAEEPAVELAMLPAE